MITHEITFDIEHGRRVRLERIDSNSFIAHYNNRTEKYSINQFVGGIEDMAADFFHRATRYYGGGPQMDHLEHMIRLILSD